MQCYSWNLIVYQPWTVLSIHITQRCCFFTSLSRLLGLYAPHLLSQASPVCFSTVFTHVGTKRRRRNQGILLHGAKIGVSGRYSHLGSRGSSPILLSRICKLSKRVVYHWLISLGAHMIRFLVLEITFSALFLAFSNRWEHGNWEWAYRSCVWKTPMPSPAYCVFEKWSGGFRLVWSNSGN